MNSYPELEINRSGPQLEYVTDLFHRIQSLLPVEDAARTSMLSKSWLHAWSTIPTLRFHKPSSTKLFVSSEQDLNLIDRTVVRYQRDNIPIQTFDVRIKISNQESASLFDKWIQTVATHTCLKNLSLVICIFDFISKKFILPDEIFSGVNLDTIIIRLDGSSLAFSTVWVTQNPVINCVSLRVLELFDVEISDEVVNNLLSTCTLLEKIDLSSCSGLTKIKIKNLRYLQKFILVSNSEEYQFLEVDDVPNLQFFQYEPLRESYIRNPRTFNIDSLSSLVTELSLFDVMIDVAYFDKIIPKFPFLESLKLQFRNWSPEKLVITSVSLKKLTLRLFENRQMDVQVYAPKLLHLFYRSTTITNLSLPNHTIPENIQLHCRYVGVLDIDIDDLKRWLPVQATNVYQLSFVSYSDEGLVHPSYFDAMFTI